MTTIYIVEDDHNILEIETYALENAGFTVKGFDHSESFFQAMKTAPDMILLDIMLPDQDGMSILKTLRKDSRTEHIPIIMVTAKTLEMDTVKALDLGADDYITKPFGVMELISRVKAVLRRSSRREPQFLQLGPIQIQPDQRRCTVDEKEVMLTYKEYELLLYLVKNKGIVVQRESLLDKIWGIDYEGESRTLDVHVKTLRQKLGPAGSLIQTIRNVGYIAK
ncbi:MAG: response regulator transcription factor [Erysipelotrichaceae bacterium]|nr:response regulator transcription factor [Erysipelotrichaceae bacterium]